MTLSCDLGLIHRARRGFVYRDFTTCEDEGSCPLVSRMPKRRNLFTLNRWSRSLMDQRPRSRRDFANREFVRSYPLTTPSRESTKCYPTAMCPVPMDGSEYFEDFQDFVESTLLPMQGLRSTVNRAPTDPWIYGPGSHRYLRRLKGSRY
jgi:hypothetical protein